MDSFAKTLQIKIMESGQINKEFAKNAFIKKNVLDGILYDETPDKWTLQKISRSLNIDIEEVESWLPIEKTIIQPVKKTVVQANFKKPKSPLKASGRFCIRCWFNNKGYIYDNVEMAHYTGMMQGSLSKGISLRVPDILKCPLCRDKCHKHFDQPKVRKSIELSHEFLFLISLFIAQEFEKGNIIIK